MPGDALAANTMLEEYRAYLETLTYIQIDPRLRSELSLSDVIQGTMVEAWHDLERIEALDDEGRKHRLRRMLINNLKDMIDRATAKIRDLRRRCGERPIFRIKHGKICHDFSSSGAG